MSSYKSFIWRAKTINQLAMLVTLTLTTLLPTGCSSTIPEGYPLISLPLTAPAPDIELTEVTHQAADAMIQDLGDKLRSRAVMLPSTFVNADNLEQTSSLGRLMAKQMASRFVQAGHSIVEMALRKEILLKKGAGQFVLSEEIQQIRKTHNVSAVLAGSYVTAGKRIFVNAQLIRTQDGIILASNDFSMPLTASIRALLK